MCNKAVDNYSHALEFPSECFMTQKIVKKVPILILPQCNLLLNAL